MTHQAPLRHGHSLRAARRRLTSTDPPLDWMGHDQRRSLQRRGKAAPAVAAMAAAQSHLADSDIACPKADIDVPKPSQQVDGQALHVAAWRWPGIRSSWHRLSYWSRNVNAKEFIQSILACPICSGPFAVALEAVGCPACGHSFPQPTLEYIDLLPLEVMSPDGWSDRGEMESRM